MNKLAAQTEMLINRIRKNRRRLKSWRKRTQVTCYRLYDRDIPEIPLAVDWYEGRLHVAEYDSIHGRSTEEQRAYIAEMVEGLASALEVASGDVFIKQRRHLKGGQLHHVDRGGERFEVGEGGHRFLVNLSDKLDTGLFFDHRTTRAMVEREAAGKAFLNLFAYTGSFSVYAGCGGAKSTTTVDLSQSNLSWAEDNLKRNGLGGTDHRLFRNDAFEFLTQARRRRERYDLVVVDPPTFSVSKGASEFDVQRDHAGLIARTLEVTAAGGVLFFSTNNQRFELDGDAFDGAETVEITDQTQAEDFRGRAHRCWRARKRS